MNAPSFSLDDFGEHSNAPHCKKCPGCYTCGLVFRYVCQMYRHQKEFLRHQIYLPSLREHLCSKDSRTCEGCAMFHATIERNAKALATCTDDVQH